MSELDFKHRLVVNNYLRGMSQKKAAVKAGFSEHSAADLFRRRDIREEIDRRLKVAEKKVDMDKEWLLDKLRIIIEADPGELIEVDDQGRPSLDWSNMSPSLRKAISKVSITETKSGKKYGRSKTVVNIDTPDRLAAIKEVATLLGLREEKHKIDLEDGLIRKLQDARQRVNGSTEEE